jgi:spermidine synthase
VDGIEIDGAVVQAGYDFFDLRDERIRAIVGDGRYELNQLAGNYDVITIDAYKVPYIPWHLTTVEFFEEVRGQLTAEGVVAINVGRAPNDRRLVEALTATLQEVFPTIHTVDVPGTLNTILFATVQRTNAADLATHAPTHPLVAQVVGAAVTAVQPTSAGDGVLFRDDRAPVETIVDSLVVRYLLAEGLAGLPGGE